MPIAMKVVYAANVLFEIRGQVGDTALAEVVVIQFFDFIDEKRFPIRVDALALADAVGFALQGKTPAVSGFKGVNVNGVFGMGRPLIREGRVSKIDTQLRAMIQHAGVVQIG